MDGKAVCVTQHPLPLEGTSGTHLEFSIQPLTEQCIGGGHGGHSDELNSAPSCKGDTVYWKKQVKTMKIDCAEHPDRKRRVTRTPKVSPPARLSLKEFRTR